MKFTYARQTLLLEKLKLDDKYMRKEIITNIIDWLKEKI